MTTFLACVIAVLNPFDCAPPVPAVAWEGHASGYAPGVMEGVVEMRQSWGHLPSDDHAVDGYIAVLWCELIGDVVTLHHYDGATVRERRVMVADCDAEDWGTYRWMIDAPYAVELGGKLWEELGSGWVWVWR